MLLSFACRAEISTRGVIAHRRFVHPVESQRMTRWRPESPFRNAELVPVNGLSESDVLVLIRGNADTFIPVLGNIEGFAVSQRHPARFGLEIEPSVAVLIGNGKIDRSGGSIVANVILVCIKIEYPALLLFQIACLYAGQGTYRFKAPCLQRLVQIVQQEQYPFRLLLGRMDGPEGIAPLEDILIAHPLQLFDAFGTNRK